MMMIDIISLAGLMMIYIYIYNTATALSVLIGTHTGPVRINTATALSVLIGRGWKLARRIGLILPVRSLCASRESVRYSSRAGRRRPRPAPTPSHPCTIIQVPQPPSARLAPPLVHHRLSPSPTAPTHRRYHQQLVRPVSSGRSGRAAGQPARQPIPPPTQPPWLITTAPPTMRAQRASRTRRPAMAVASASPPLLLCPHRPRSGRGSALGLHHQHQRTAPTP